MRRKIVLLLVACLIIQAVGICAIAAVPATPNQKLAFRTGPNTKYAELYTLPQSTAITAVEYESGNGVTWVLVEFRYNGETVRAYTGLKRMAVHGNIPWASHINSIETVSQSTSVWAAPGYNAAYRGWVNYGEEVTLLYYENGYAYIEFYDYESGALSRGYIYADMIETAPSAGPIIIIPNAPSLGVSATPNQKLSFRTGPNTAYPDLFTLPQDTRITAVEYESGNGVTWVLVEFEFQGMRCRGYTGLKRMTVHGNIPWADHLYLSAEVNYHSTVLAAPYVNAYYRGSVDSGDYVSVLGYENGYAHIEYYDYTLGMNSRGYVPVGAVN